MTQLRIGGDTFRVEVEGDPTRPPLLLSNSLGTDLHLWDSQMPALTEHFRVIRYDSRGHGGSVTNAGPYSIDDLGNDALRILDALEIDKTHVLGISMGGAVAQWLLVAAPDRIERAVLACTAAKFGTPESWNARILTVRRDGMGQPADATMERWFSAAFSKKAPRRIAPIRAMLLGTSPEGYASCCAALRDMDLRQALHGIETPVLILTGADDPVISASDTTFLKDALVESAHVSLDARHIANIEAEAAFTEAAVKFLTARRSTRRRKAAAALVKPAPRGKAVAHATAARQPLAKATSRPRKARTSAKGARKTAAAKVRKASSPRAKRAGTSARPAPARAPAKKATAPAKKTPAKASPARRPTKATAARGAVKKAATKAKPTKTKKKAAKVSAKRLPTPRRKPSKTPRRPSGRRKT